MLQFLANNFFFLFVGPLNEMFACLLFVVAVSFFRSFFLPFLTFQEFQGETKEKSLFHVIISNSGDVSATAIDTVRIIPV